MKSKQPPFDSHGKFVASRTFRFCGRTFAPGEEFDWRRLSCSARKLFQLYDNRFLTLAVEAPEPGSPEAGPSPEELEAAKAKRREAAKRAAATRKRNAEAAAKRAEAELQARAAESESEESSEED